jgi:hypothetical protein
MADSIESVKPILTVIDDEGDLIINSTGPRGKAMVQAVLALANSARKISVISDGDMKVMKRQAGAGQPAQLPQTAAEYAAKQSAPSAPAPPDIQDQFAADLESGVTGEQATGESPTPTPGPSDPVVIPAQRRKPQIFQDAAAPPAPELALAEMDRLLAEAEQAEEDQVREAEDRRFQAQQAVQAGQEPAVPTEPVEVKAAPRKREPRNLATTGRPCGRCAGAGQIVGEAGFQGACPVCHGEGQVKTWDRSLKIR